MAPVCYEMSVPLFIRGLTNLHAILKKSEKWAEDNNVPKEKLTEARLADDMLPLTFQIQSACNGSKLSAVRVAGIENVPVEDKEKTFPELYERIEKTIDFLKNVKPEQYEGKEDAEVVLKLPSSEYKFTGASFLQKFAVPNFFFHETTAYAILRNQGVPLSKWDYLGKDV